VNRRIVQGLLLWCLWALATWASPSRAEDPNSSAANGHSLEKPTDVSGNVQAPYKRPSGATTPSQRSAVQGKPCVDCGESTSKQVADHKTPLVKEYYETGQIDKTRMREVDAVQPQCPKCSAKQGASLSRYSKKQKKSLKSK